MKKRNWILYFGKKLMAFVLSVFVLSVVVFYVARLAPGDPLVSYYGERAEKMSPEERQWAMEKLGLDQPVYIQYGKWVENAFQGDFGISFKYKQDVARVISGTNHKYSFAGRNRISSYFCRLPSSWSALCVA